MIWAALLLGGLALPASCNTAPAPPQDPYAVYRPAVKPEFQRDFALMDKAPRYALTVGLSPATDVLTGTGEIVVTNYSADTWRYLVFRLYPSLAQYGGEMIIQGLSVNNQPTTFVYQSANTALRVDLAEPLPPDAQVTVRVQWRLAIPRWSDNSSIYALYGRSQQMISLPLFYPSLAVYQPNPQLGLGSWWQEMGTARGDAAFNVASLFVVTATLPIEQVPVASGTLVQSTVVDDFTAQHVWVTGPAREFLLHMSPLFRSESVETYGTRVVSYWLPGQEAAGRAALDHSVAALRIYSDYFGAYPFRDLRVAPAPINFRGMEYPQVTLLGVELYTRFQNSLETLVAHEVAHQWWYQIVHNDPVNMPWLDEGLAEYSVRLYYQQLRGQGAALQLQRLRWQAPLDLLVGRNLDSVLDRAVSDFENSNQYETVVYGKGALFYAGLFDILGERRFRRLMQEYLERYRYGIVDTEMWRAELRRLQLARVDALMDAWIGPVERPLPTATPEPTPDAESAEPIARR